MKNRDIQPLLQSLEPRRLLSASLSGGQLNIDGTGRSDDITVDIDSSGLISVNINGSVSSFDQSAVDSIRVRGLSGNDYISLTGRFDNFDIAVSVFGNTGRDTILGAAGNDDLFGEAGLDTIFGNAGHDNIYGGAGDDDLSGDAGLDWIWGDDGDDSILGGTSRDLLYGGFGDDTLIGGQGDDDLW